MKPPPQHNPFTNPFLQRSEVILRRAQPRNNQQHHPRSLLPPTHPKTKGKLVFMSSILGSVELAAGMPMLNDAYAVTRAALNMLIRKWGAALRLEGITTAVIHPGESFCL
jgi:NAD(P)-dependent dehydrogenase (short-subunit alcohol dehydrogenase family)